jgi:SAM-dependent methyltransferase
MIWTDQNYLLKDQYKDAANLNARLNLHKHFSVNKNGWFPWLFDQMELAPECRLLEVACGTGELWLANMHRIPPGWDITLSDFSAGMLVQARENLANALHHFKFEQIDIQSIPYGDGHFDTVMANHVFYYIPDKPKALSEVRRVLKTGGKFIASTVGKSHLLELGELVGQFVGSEACFYDDSVNSFLLENGRERLTQFFDEVQLYRYEDCLVVNEAAPLVAYVLSGKYKTILEKRSEEFLHFIERIIQTQGAIRITKDSGLFTATQASQVKDDV